ncbi:MAG: hydroxymethylbilane synthase [archaeon]|nr:hydroxymethylbilane synthase [archaeon]
MIAGTRESQLAMAQTLQFKEVIEKAVPGLVCEIKGMTSFGDVDLQTHLKNMGGTGVFVRELDAALLAGKVDVTVNSLKDIPTVMDERLVVAAVLPRADVRDAMMPMPLEDVPADGVVGTSSVRREKMLNAARPGLGIKTIRGNMNTRMEKLENGEYTSILMAKAGLDRLGITEGVNAIDKELFIPAAGQGAIAVECRADDKETLELLKKIDDAKTRAEVKAERDVLRHMNAGCTSPIGVNAELNGDEMRMLAISYINDPPIRIDITFPLSEVDIKTKEIANTLLGKKE